MIDNVFGLVGNGVFCTVEDLFFEGLKARNLDLHQIAKTSTVSSGTKRSLIRGRGMEFFESRPYVPLDEMRTIDWKVSARFSKLYTKIFVEERDRPIYCVVDLRPSMFFGSKRCFKSVLAAHLAARLATAAVNGGDQICGLVFDRAQKGQGVLGHNKKHLARLLGSIAEGTKRHLTDEKTEWLSWSQMLSRINHRLRPGALVFLLSDFLDVDETIEPLLFQVRKRAHIFALSISDPLEEHMPALGRVGMAFGDERVVFDSNDRVLKKNYEHWWKERQQKTDELFKKLGITHLRFTTAQEPDALLRALLARPRMVKS